MKTYRTGFLLAVSGNIVLALILAGLWWHYRSPKPEMDAKSQGMAASAAQDSTESSVRQLPAQPRRHWCRCKSLPAIAEHRSEDRRGRAEARRR